MLIESCDRIRNFDFVTSGCKRPEQSPVDFDLSSSSCSPASSLKWSLEGADSRLGSCGSLELRSIRRAPARAERTEVPFWVGVAAECSA